MQLTFDFKQKQIPQAQPTQKAKGQIFTRPQVVEFMLTVLGLTQPQDFHQARILEPACGEGEFTSAIVKRWVKHHPPTDTLIGKLLAIDLDETNIQIAKIRVQTILANHGYEQKEIEALLDSWFICTDFLLEPIPHTFTHIIGNPPYVRVEQIAKPLLAQYRQRYTTMTNRADLYIPFFEKSLSLLETGGRLSFICTDRWTKNQYGKALRQFISKQYSLELFIDLYNTDAFVQNVLTYPAITQIVRNHGKQTLVWPQPTFSIQEANKIHHNLTNQAKNALPRKQIVNGARPWLIGTTQDISLVSRLEKQYPTLEEAGCKVFIGAATGANDIYIVDGENNTIETSRLLPVITANEISAGDIQWHKNYLINTFDEQGLIHLPKYPKLETYLNQHKSALSKRYVARKSPTKWYRTIDRIYPERAKQAKLLIPDIGSEPTVVYDEGMFYPNNSIYYICSQEWDLQALRVILLSQITKTFISMYSTKIANGYMRFQAQHLRKLRLPKWQQVPTDLKDSLIHAGTNNLIDRFTELSYQLYGLENDN